MLILRTSAEVFYMHEASVNVMKVLTAVVIKEEDMYVARCPEIGTVSQGATVEEAVKNLKEATALYLEEFPRKEIARPILTTFEVAEVVKT